MVWDGFLLFGFALGHFCILIYLANILHGLPVWERAMMPLTLGLGVVWLVIGGLIAWALPGLAWPTWPTWIALYAVVCWAVGLVGFPAATLWLHLRKTPECVRETSAQIIDLAEREGSAALVGRGARARMLLLPGCEALKLNQRQWSVSLAGLPTPLEGLSVLHLTDFHFSLAYDRRFFDAVIDEVADDEPDLVVFTGDLIDDRACLDWIEPVFGRLRARLGRFAILGNHDTAFDTALIRRLLANAGFTDLEGRWELLTVEGASLAVGGTSVPWGPPLALGQHRAADLRMVLSHSPDQFYRAARAGIDLVLAGHNHGGQIRVPVIGPIVMPSLYGRRFDRGFFQRAGTLMFVGQGIGGKHPVRYGCMPEINRLVLSRAGTTPHTRRRAAASAGEATAV